ncbi:MAG TPA: cytidylate kinase family protein [Candidatus Scybalocola faecavium]|nr:cytidylate kinase family protein [Candidatus Scybalocola faecavium]
MLRIQERRNTDRDHAIELIKKTDKDRAGYHNYYTNTKWRRAENYDLCLSSSLCGTEKTADLLEQLVRASIDFHKA